MHIVTNDTRSAETTSFWYDLNSTILFFSLTDLYPDVRGMPRIPLVRYEPRYAHAIGRWFLNAANAARLFYPNELPAENQTCATYARETQGVIAHEGLAKARHGRPPLAMGDALMHGWGTTDFSLYGSCLVGVFGSLIQRTNDAHRLQLDCLRTDFFRDDAYATHLYYNPHARRATVRVDVGPGDVTSTT
jgi:hypothetical protein